MDRPDRPTPSKTGLLAVVLLAALLTAGLSPAAADHVVPVTVELPLTWTGRSTESAADVVESPILGGAVAAALALPLDPDQPVFDDGQATPEPQLGGVDEDVEWASWPEYTSAGFEARRIQATFDLVLPGPFSEEVPDPAALPPNVARLVLSAPFYTEQGDIIPVNDNIYVHLNGRLVAARGTAYGAMRAPAGEEAGDPFAFADETDGWFVDGVLPQEALQALRLGENTLDIVGEEVSGWGGMTRLELRLEFLRVVNV